MKTYEIQMPIPGQRKDIAGENQLLELIDKHCQEYLKSVKIAHKWLLRGVKNSETPAFIGNSKKDRPPRDSIDRYSKQWDYILTSLGITAQRHNSIFATTKKSLAKNFGVVYLIFPIDHAYSFSYTNERDIVLTHLESFRWVNLHAINKFKYKLRALANHSNDVVKMAVELSLNLKDKDLWRSLPQLEHTILKDHIPAKYWDDTYYLDVDKFVREFQPQDTDLQTALAQGYEVLINGSYIALDYQKYATQVSNYWQVPVVN